MTDTKPVIIIEPAQPPRIVDFRDGLQSGEFFVLLLLLYSVVSKLSPIVVATREAYNTIAYLNKDTLAQQVELQKLLDQLLAVTYSDRVVIGLFHNGTKDNLGFHLEKMSVYAESHTENLPSIKDKLQNIPINYIREEILLADSVEYQTITRTSLDSVCDYHLDDIGAVRKDFRTFRGSKRDIYGIINFHYTQEPETHWQDDIHRYRQVAKITNRIEQILYLLKNPDTPKWKQLVNKLMKQTGL